MLMDWLLIGGGAAGAFLAIYSAAKVVRGAWLRVDAFLADWNGDPARPGWQGRQSMPERVSALEGRLAAVELQVTPNGGETATLADRVVRVERQTGAHQGGEE